ncbi:hypothetical protein ambt_10970 [Alteromonas naphthalenivorans]|uniref:Uncharacterized protein n=2 Tax=Alteromonas naphthalenivorans TaxID=715451 RepID=F5ZCV4_ALTNA|nr:hypothetical protein ambt_10970 [Alteromonas naphthalenivorans]
MNILIAFTSPMKLTETKFTKAEVLYHANVTSSQFNNWVLRRYIPRLELGFKLESLTRAKYSVLIIAYCRLLNYHTGPRKSAYVALLKQAFIKIAKTDEFNPDFVFAIDGWGKAKDCGLFENSQIARQLFSRQCAIVPAGKTITTLRETLDHD